MTAAESEKIGLGVSHFDPNLGAVSDGNSGVEGKDAMGRKLRRKMGCSSHPRKTAYRGWPLAYDACWVGLASEPGYYPEIRPAKTEVPEEDRLITCPVDRQPFHPRRADNIYCSDACRRKGARMGGKGTAVGGRMENESFMRICEGPGCEESLAGRKASARFHAAKCRKRAAYHQRMAQPVPFRGFPRRETGR